MNVNVSAGHYEIVSCWSLSPSKGQEQHCREMASPMGLEISFPCSLLHHVLYTEAYSKIITSRLLVSSMCTMSVISIIALSLGLTAGNSYLTRLEGVINICIVKTMHSIVIFT